MTTEAGEPVKPPFSHRFCFLCGDENPSSLKLKFKSEQDGSVQAEFNIAPTLQGYEGILHGGVICSLLDCAMTHCLFLRNISAFTAELKVRFLSPVPISSRLLIKACLKDIVHGIYRLSGEISSEGRTFARAESKFRETVPDTSARKMK
ncbi:PaaI family thioesterase [candidate division WOR-3 bacterium]|nr:PaaI family thioesterase [candidate division WOR-3 bacterium]